MSDDDLNWTSFTVGDPPSGCLLALYRATEEDFIMCSSREVPYLLEHCKDITHWRVVFRAPDERAA